MFVLIFLLFTIIILCVTYYGGKYNETYWRKRGVVFHKDNKLTGVNWAYLMRDEAMFQILHAELYNKYPNEPAVGHGSFFRPALYLRDLRNILHVVQQDFKSFNHRGTDVNAGDQLADNILFMQGNRWKLTRQSMTPLFTRTKLKNMFYIIDQSARDFIIYLKNNPEVLNDDTFETLNTFSSAAVGAAVFGINTKSTIDSPFLEMAEDVFKPSLLSFFKGVLNGFSPSIYKLLKIKLFAKYEDFFISAIKQVIRRREQEKVQKHDFADMCVSLQSKGVLRDSETGYELKPTDELLAAQGFFFFIAGVEPSSTAIFTTLLELGRLPYILQKVHEEVDETFEKCAGNITYEVISDMSYLDKVLSEALRMYPPIGFSPRVCVKDSVLPIGNIKVDKGTLVMTPIYEIHHDEKYYPKPEEFNPERFPDAKNNVFYMPFGVGARKCIGERYAKVQVMTCLAHLLRNFTVNTYVHEGGVRFKKTQIQVRPINVDVKLIPRYLTAA